MPTGPLDREADEGETPDTNHDVSALHHANALHVHEVVLDPVFARRRDTLLRSVPVHDIVSRAERADSGITGFDVRALILAAFDAVIARQGFPDRATPTDLLTLLEAIAQVQVPDAGTERCSAAATHVLDGLTNRREREHKFTVMSTLYSRDGDENISAQTVPRRFWLLRELEDPLTGRAYLECSVDAVNALVGGLDLPIEDQQTALEIVLERQLARGELDAAHATAVQARRLTAGYLVQIEALLAETERYLPGTDWRVTAPRLIDEALEHIGECLTREGRLLEHVAASLGNDALADMTARRRIRITTSLTTLLSESRHLHTVLMEKLIGARGRFLDAQDAQMFRPLLSAVEFDLRTDLLEPALALHLKDVETVADAYLCGLLGPRPPTVLHWGEYVDSLIHSPRDESTELEEPEAENMVFRPDPQPLVSRELLNAAHQVISEVGLPARLSKLLAASPPEDSPGASVQDLLVAAGLRAFDNSARDAAPENDHWTDEDVPSTTANNPHDAQHGVHLLEVLGPEAACVADGVNLSGPWWSGADLIVCIDRDQADAVLLGDFTMPEPIALPISRRKEHQP